MAAPQAQRPDVPTVDSRSRAAVNLLDRFVDQPRHDDHDVEAEVTPSPHIQFDESVCRGGSLLTL